ncbi:hypothetical protein ANN_23484 [Periplaneta americana]|uniref:Uncharacterized protein n=1 Tax=Periplaneta americana TaxID=6978 RepID=A0ABQ8SLP0_PERAM|nr:hypothetical protein ANN_23484 [Periplaneta americana]
MRRPRLATATVTESLKFTTRRTQIFRIRLPRLVTTTVTDSLKFTRLSKFEFPIPRAFLIARCVRNSLTRPESSNMALQYSSLNLDCVHHIIRLLYRRGLKPGPQSLPLLYTLYRDENGALKMDARDHHVGPIHRKKEPGKTTTQMGGYVCEDDGQTVVKKSKGQISV